MNDYWDYMFLVAYLSLIALAFLFTYWAVPQFMNQLCHAYGYGNMVSYTFEQWTWNYEIASLKCQQASGIVKAI